MKRRSFARNVTVAAAGLAPRQLARRFDRLIARAWDRGFDDGFAYGAFVQEEWHFRLGYEAGFNEAVARAASAAFDRVFFRSYGELYDAAFRRWSDNPMPSILGVTLIDGNDDGVFEPGEDVLARYELANFGAAFDTMLADKVTTLAKAESENERLNDSVIELLKGVAQLSQRDLTVRVPVTEDVTGPVADSLNLLTDETAKVLSEVVSTSSRVASASQQVKLKSDHAAAVARAEQEQVDVTAEELDRYCRERLSNYKVPKRFVIRDELPMLPIGKIDKARLRREAVEQAVD